MELSDREGFQIAHARSSSKLSGISVNRDQLGLANQSSRGTKNESKLSKENSISGDNYL